MSSSLKIIVGLVQARTKLEQFTFVAKSSLNICYSAKLGSFIALGEILGLRPTLCLCNLPID